MTDRARETSLGPSELGASQRASEGASDSDSDVWLGSDEEPAGGPASPRARAEFYGEPVTGGPESQEVAALRRVHAKRGYLDGLSQAKEESLQAGFDNGYPAGAELGLQVGEIVGRLLFLRASRPGDQQLRETVDRAVSSLAIQKVLSRKFFDDELRLAQAHPLLAQWQETVSRIADV